MKNIQVKCLLMFADYLLYIAGGLYCSNGARPNGGDGGRNGGPSSGICSSTCIGNNYGGGCYGNKFMTFVQFYVC